MAHIVLAKAKAYWWRGDKLRNFGDELTPLLLARFANIDAAWDTVSHSSIVCVGSILEHVPPLWDGYILGAGKLYGESRLHLHTNTATILALRGPYSASGVPGDYALGDPGLLADELVTIDTRRFKLGILPHWSDHELIHRPEFREWYPKLINPRWEPLDVVRAIGQCEKIVTSSLHGMIVADSFGIPRRVERAPAFEKEGGMFKFHDYSASIQAPFEVGRTIRASKFYVENRKDELFDAFRELGSLVRNQK